MERSLKELCEILGVSPGASSQEVKQAYRDLVQFWHPDKHADKIPRLRQLAEEKMKEINGAYEVLKDGVPCTEPQSDEYQSSARPEYTYTSPAAASTNAAAMGSASQPIENPNSGCAVAATAVSILLCIYIFPIVFVSQERRLVKKGGWFSSNEYESVQITSWTPVIFWTVIICGVIYGLVLWKRWEPFKWMAFLVFMFVFWFKIYSALMRADPTKTTTSSYQSN